MKTKSIRRGWMSTRIRRRFGRRGAGRRGADYTEEMRRPSCGGFVGQESCYRPCGIKTFEFGSLSVRLLEQRRMLSVEAKQAERGAHKSINKMKR